MSILSSLTNRIFLASALLLLVSMSVAIWRVTASVTAQAENDLDAGLSEAASLVDRLSRTEFGDFVVKAQLIADLPVLKGAAATDDAPTVLPIAREYQQRMGADLFVVLNRRDQVLAQAGRVQMDPAQIARVVGAARGTRDGTAFWPNAGGLLHVAVVPIEPAFGTLVVGVSLDEEAVLRIRTVTNSEIAFVHGAQILASTLDGLSAADAALASHARGSFTIQVGAEEYVARIQPVGDVERGNEPFAIVLRSRTQHLRFLPSLRWQIALTGLAAVLVATVAGYLVARTVTRPLRALTGAMSDMARTGDLTRALPALGRWDDEDVRLVATTFHQLTSAVDRFQREASLKERLSSLGRLSTVVAHEIRNPLMIIKTAVRRLRRHPSPDVVDVATSIDEEVGRLNRVVSGVLDFARPVQFAVAPVNVRSLCTDAAQAALSAADDVPVLVTAEAGWIATDAERVRAVLVNLLTNAQHGVRLRRDNGGQLVPVELSASRSAAGHWRIVVADRGAGIKPEHLPRIFDPFFTTRRTGSGLGLAIAKNLIEGLGGTIRIDSRWGEGTIVIVDLPSRSTAEETPS
ncbi:MAG: hypothetical protein IT184_10520 [Acidobacteria bacterium]|nr:hypothetical protein [Acidobacteriota bacterium]